MSTILRKLASIKTDLLTAAREAIANGETPNELLTTSNPKIAKGEKEGYASYILHLAPARLGGIEVCPSRSAGCTAACLNTAGRGGMIANDDSRTARDRATIQYARILKTVFFAQERAAFMAMLQRDIDRAIRSAARKNLTPVFRLNGTSDIAWETLPFADADSVFAKYPRVQFYDYTKRFPRAVAHCRGDLPANYHLTFSRCEDTMDDTVASLAHLGGNSAVVFAGKTLPESWLGIPVVNADETDLRFLDPAGVIAGLKAKGIARSDSSGFVVAA